VCLVTSFFNSHYSKTSAEPSVNYSVDTGLRLVSLLLDFTLRGTRLLDFPGTRRRLINVVNILIKHCYFNKKLVTLRDATVIIYLFIGKLASDVSNELHSPSSSLSGTGDSHSLNYYNIQMNPVLKYLLYGLIAVCSFILIVSFLCCMDIRR